jgi:hypothetical protein
VLGVGQHVAIEHVGQNTLMVVGEFPIRSLFRLRVVDSLEADPVVAGVGALPVGLLLLPVPERVRLGMVALVDQQELRARGRQEVDVSCTSSPPRCRRWR